MDDFLEATKYRSGAKEHRFFFARSVSDQSALKRLLLPEHLKIVHDEAFADGNVQAFFNDKTHFEIEIDAFEILTVYRQPQRLQVGKLMQQGLKCSGAKPLSLLSGIQVIVFGLLAELIVRGQHTEDLSQYVRYLTDHSRP